MKQEELENYMNTYGRELYSFCCFVTGNRQEADDLYQDTFLKVYELGDRLIIRKNPKGFLLSVAMNLYRNHRRKLSARLRIVGTRVSAEETLGNIPSGEPLTEERAIAEETGRILRREVERLPDKYRLPILLFYMEELSLADIAGILELPEGTVKSRIHRAKKILRQRLEDGGK